MWNEQRRWRQHQNQLAQTYRMKPLDLDRCDWTSCVVDQQLWTNNVAVRSDINPLLPRPRLVLEFSPSKQVPLDSDSGHSLFNLPSS